MHSLPYDVEAMVTYLPTEHGGKTKSVTNGYRPQFYYDGEDFGATHPYPDVERVSPGESARVFLTFLHPDLHVGRLHPGKAFLIREGHKVFGYGTVTRIADLEISAERLRRLAI
jgi:elongation factor Tu